MTTMLDPSQVEQLHRLFGAGAEQATLALARWLDRPACITVERVEQLPLNRATDVLGDSETPISACVMRLQGELQGQLILAFDDASGLGLADLLLGQPLGTAKEWGEIERSAAQETANIVGCAYLNALSRLAAGQGRELLPDPPRFVRDYPQALLQFALMNQASHGDLVFLTETRFQIDGSPVNWNLLLVPDTPSIERLRSWLPCRDGLT
jgi:chemotaxis protein CheC